MGKNLKREGLTVAVILLFIGLAVSPSIYADIIPEEEYAEFTTEVCGLPGYEPETIQLTQNQADEVDRIFENLRMQLNSSVSLEETVDIYTDAVDELNKLGLLGDMSVHLMKRLIQRQYQLNKFLEDKLIFNSEPLEGEVYENRFCFIAGVVDNCDLSGISYALLWYLLSLDTNGIFIFLGYTLFLYAYFLFAFYRYKILHIFDVIYFGYTFSYDEPVFRPSSGWLSTTGLGGTWKTQGKFKGDLFEHITGGPFTIIYPGALNFCGIEVYNYNTDKHYILGITSHVKIKTVDDT